MTDLARKLRVTDYFSLGWGAMVGVGWLVVMDDWLGRGGPLGAMLGFAIGGALLLPIGYVYGDLVARLPDAAGEVAYTAQAFSRPLSAATGWMMLLAYFCVCPWEAIAVGRIASYVFPALDAVPLYTIAGKTVFLPHVVLGLGLTALITGLNYRGIRLSASFQTFTAVCVLGLFAVFSGAAFAKGSVAHVHPLFPEGVSPLVAILLVVQIVPYYMTGYESVGKAAEESHPGFRPGNFLWAIWAAILVAIFFYVTVVATVAWSAPWQSLLSTKFLTAVALEHAVGAHWVVQVILLAAMLSLFKVFNGCFVAASRVLFALGRRGLVQESMGEVHAVNRTPARAVLAVGIGTALFMFLGSAILVPISEVGSVAVALGWMAACASALRLGAPGKVRWAAYVGLAVTVAMVLMKVLPFVPGAFSQWEWLACAVWVLLGLAAHRRPASAA